MRYLRENWSAFTRLKFQRDNLVIKGLKLQDGDCQGEVPDLRCFNFFCGKLKSVPMQIVNLSIAVSLVLS